MSDNNMKQSTRDYIEIALLVAVVVLSLINLFK